MDASAEFLDTMDRLTPRDVWLTLFYKSYEGDGLAYTKRNCCRELSGIVYVLWRTYI